MPGTVKVTLSVVAPLVQIAGIVGWPLSWPRAPTALQPVAGLMLQMCLGPVQVGACSPWLRSVKLTVEFTQAVSLGAMLKSATGIPETRIWPICPVRVSHGLVIRHWMVYSPPATTHDETV